MDHQKIKMISFLRGFSIFTIVVMHLLMRFDFAGIWGKLIMFGGAGVHVFFLCSGFGLFYSHLNKPLNYANFLKKRFFKIYKPYIISVALWSIWEFFRTQQIPLTEISSHVFLWKMFSIKYDTSLCYAYWFISTILQFYLCWPLIVKLMKCKKGLFIAIFISLCWSTTVGLLNYEEQRPWSSFFLQYLWEFCLGMYLANQYYNYNTQKTDISTTLFNIKNWKYHYIFIGIIIGMSTTGIMGFRGGFLKLYNDMPSLIAFSFCAILIYKASPNILGRIFCFFDQFSYELYLTHALIYAVYFYLIGNTLPIYVNFVFALILALFFAWAFKLFLRKLNLKV